MNIENEITAYLESLPERKRTEMELCITVSGNYCPNVNFRS
jgi:hypothetical protein